MRYLEVSVRAQREAADAVETLLAGLAGGGVVVEDPADVAGAIAEERWDATDLVPGDTRWVTIRAYLADVSALEQSRQQLADGLERVRSLGLGTVEPPRFRWVDEQDWANTWKQYFKPLRVGQRLVVVPSWEEYTPAPEDLPLYLDPGMAFGTGQHATTHLCLEWLESELRPGEAVLDLGTGSGILAIAAARLGAGPVLGLEIDPVAVAVARENLARNGLADRVLVLEATFDDPVAAVGAGTPGAVPVLMATGPESDVALAWLGIHRPALLVANLTAGILVDLRRGLAAALPPGGRLLASGVIRERRAEVEAGLAAVGLQLEEVRERENWLALRFRRS